MREKEYQAKHKECGKEAEIYQLRMVEGIPACVIAEKMGMNRGQVYYLMSKFERENPQLADKMKKKGKDVVPEDYKELLEEVKSLKKALAHERLRADFYEEMVAFGKEVYGIDLKKAGTK